MNGEDTISADSHALIIPPFNGHGKQIYHVPFSDSSMSMPPRPMDPKKDLAVYGYRSVAWKEKMEEGKKKQNEKLQVVKHQGYKDGGIKGGDDLDDPDLPKMDEGRQPLSRKIPISSSKMNPYRIIILLRILILGLFFHYRILHPVNDAYGLWLTSIICEIWFAVSWIIDQFPKWFPIERETYLDRLSLRYIAFLSLSYSHVRYLSLFALWVNVHLYPFLKGFMGKQDRLPIIIVVWSILLASMFSLLWVRINPCLSKDGIVLEVCGLDCD